MRWGRCLATLGMAALCIWARSVGGLPSNHAGVLNYGQTNGKSLFATYCSVCHGATGEGDGFNAFNLNPRPRNLTDGPAMRSFSDDQLIDAIASSGGRLGKSNLMPSWRHTLNHRQIRYLVAYVRVLSTVSGTGRQR